jgi:thiamine pyrophosphokinase
MTAGLTRFEDNVTLLGGGELSAATVSELLTLAPNLVACDGGAARALDFGLMPRLVVGDMDSLGPQARAQIDPTRILEIAEQDSTDFDKAIRSIETPMILGAGFMGRRADHALAAFNTLVRYASRAIILVGEYDVCFHTPAALRLDLEPGMRVSLFPMTELIVSAKGLEWPLDRLKLSPAGRVGTSNRANANLVEIAPGGDGLLVFLPRRALPAVIDALSSSAR